MLKRIHSHSLSAEEARLLNTGVIDVQLLKDALLHVPPELAECSKAKVRFAACKWSEVARRAEPVFDVHDSSGKYVGSYFASAFISFSR